MIVGSKLPHSLTIEHQSQVIVINGANVDYDGDRPWENGLAPDSPLRASGVGLTMLEGAKAEAFADWCEVSSKGHGPVSTGIIFYTDKKADAEREARALEGESTGLDGLDPDKDLPKGLETDKDGKKEG